MKLQATLRAASEDIIALEQLRELMRDMSFECDMESHTLNGRRLIVVDDEGNVVTQGGGHFAWPNGQRLDKETKGWPAGHRAEPCGKCWGCKVVSLGIGRLDIHDGRGRREVRL